jgi:Cu-Zn family superoxide dismutase
MKNLRSMELTTLAALLAVGLSLPALSQSMQTAKAQLKDAGGKDVGAVDLVQTQSGVLLRVSLKGVPPGERAFHVHTVGKCEPPFDSAGGHFNPTGHKHGMYAGQSHAGDMPNLHVPANGELAIEVLNAAITLEKGKPNSVFHPNGTAIIIHAGKDDYKTDPTGNAGGRIACGVISEGPATSGTAPQ